MKQHYQYSHALLAGFLFLCGGSLLWGQEHIRSMVVGTGATVATEGRVVLRATVGQPLVGLVAHSRYTLGEGFWYGQALSEGTTSVEPDEGGLLPQRNLSCYPNRLNQSAELYVRLGSPGRVHLHVRDAMGRVMITLLDHEMTSGEHRLRFDASHLSSGIYLLQLRTDQEEWVERITVVR